VTNVTALDHFGKVCVELYDRATARELGTAEILEPQLRTLHAIEQTLRSVGERHHGGLLAARSEIAKDEDVALEDAGIGCGVARSADDADVAARIAEDACVRVRGANHAMSLVGYAPHAGGGHRVGDKRSYHAGKADDAIAEFRPALHAGVYVRDAMHASAPGRRAYNGGAFGRHAQDGLPRCRPPNDAIPEVPRAENAGPGGKSCGTRGSPVWP
jgi:hypothetical protein